MDATREAEPPVLRDRLRRGSSIAWAVLLVLASIGVHTALPKPAKYAVEILLLAPLIVTFALHPGVRSLLAGLPLGLRRFAMVWIALLLVGNVLKQQRVMFPFMGWGMFGRAVSSEPSMVRLTALRPDGTSFRLIPAGVVSDVAVSSIDGVMKPLVVAVTQAKTAEERRRAEAALLRLIDGLARMHEHAGGRPGGPIAEMLVEDCTTALTIPYERHCESVGTFVVGEGR